MSRGRGGTGRCIVRTTSHCGLVGRSQNVHTRGPEISRFRSIGLSVDLFGTGSQLPKTGKYLHRYRYRETEVYILQGHFSGHNLLSLDSEGDPDNVG